MFPVSITLHNSIQLNAVLAALGAQDAALAVTADEVRQHRDENQTTMKDAKATVQKEKADTVKKQQEAQSSEPTPTVSDNSASSSTESQPADANEKSEPTEQSTAPTYEDAKAAVLKLGKVKGRQATLDALSRFGATKLPDVKPEAFADLIALVEEVIAGGEV